MPVFSATTEAASTFQRASVSSTRHKLHKKTRLRIIPAEKIASSTTTTIYIRFTYASSAALSFGLTSFALNSQPFLREHSIFPASPPRIFGATRGGWRASAAHGSCRRRRAIRVPSHRGSSMGTAIEVWHLKFGIPTIATTALTK